MLLDDAADPPVRGRASAAEVVTAVVMRRARPQGEVWLLLTTQDHAVWVNGSPLSTRLRVLRDRDEVRLRDGRRLFFSTERLAQIEAFPGAEDTIYCVRCRQALAPHSPAIQQCPACGVWHHQTEELLCWTYAERCAMCDQQTRLDAGFRWTPEEL
jgi:hypothetical protein